MLILCFFFFFFQAEDGIRDGTVTGVQTCALPISITMAREGGIGIIHKNLPIAAQAREVERSEERRVGKECRSRWSPDHYKQKIIRHEKTHREKAGAAGGGRQWESPALA